MSKQFINVVDPRNTFVPSGSIGTFGSAIGAIILNSHNDVLLTQRTENNDVNPGTWEIVFGRLNQGEGFEEALYREVQEEVSIQIEPLAMIGLMHFIRIDTEYNGVIFVCRAITEDVIIQDAEIKSFEWVSLEQAIDRVESYVKPHLIHVQKQFVR